MPGVAPHIKLCDLGELRPTRPLGAIFGMMMALIGRVRTNLGTNCTISCGESGHRRPTGPRRPAGVCSRILSQLADGRGRQEGSQRGVVNKGASFDSPLLATPLTTPFVLETLESTPPRQVGTPFTFQHWGQHTAATIYNCASLTCVGMRQAGGRPLAGYAPAPTTEAPRVKALRGGT